MAANSFNNGSRARVAPGTGKSRILPCGIKYFGGVHLVSKRQMGIKADIVGVQDIEVVYTLRGTQSWKEDERENNACIVFHCYNQKPSPPNRYRSDEKKNCMVQASLPLLGPVYITRSRPKLPFST